MIAPVSPGAPTVVLSRRIDRVHASIDGAEPVPARVVWARPVTAPGAELAIMDDRKRCLSMLPSLDALAPESRAIAEAELAARYCQVRIRRVLSTLVDFGCRYWTVETDRGARTFLLRDAAKNVQRFEPDRVVIRDVYGNRFEIASLAALDPASREAAERAL